MMLIRTLELQNSFGLESSLRCWHSSDPYSVTPSILNKDITWNVFSQDFKLMMRLTISNLTRPSPLSWLSPNLRSPQLVEVGMAEIGPHIRGLLTWLPSQSWKCRNRLRQNFQKWEFAQLLQMSKTLLGLWTCLQKKWEKILEKIEVSHFLCRKFSKFSAGNYQFRDWQS